MRRIRKVSARITGIHGAFSKKRKNVHDKVSSSGVDPEADSSVSPSVATILTHENNSIFLGNCNDADHTSLNEQCPIDNHKSSLLLQNGVSELPSSLSRGRHLMLCLLGFIIGSLSTFAFLYIMNNFDETSEIVKDVEQPSIQNETILTNYLVNSTTSRKVQDPHEVADTIAQSCMANQTRAFDLQNWHLLTTPFTEDAIFVYETMGGVQKGSINGTMDFFTAKNHRNRQQKNFIENTVVPTFLPTITPSFTHQHQCSTTMVEDNSNPEISNISDITWSTNHTDNDEDFSASAMKFHGTFVTPLYGVSSLSFQEANEDELVKTVDPYNGYVWKSTSTEESIPHNTLLFMMRGLTIFFFYIIFNLIFTIVSILLKRKKSQIVEGGKEKERKHIMSQNEERKAEKGINDDATTTSLPLIVIPSTPKGTPSTQRPYETDKIRELRQRRLRSQEALSAKLQSVSSVTSSPISTTSTSISSITFRTVNNDDHNIHKNAIREASAIEWTGRSTHQIKGAFGKAQCPTCQEENESGIISKPVQSCSCSSPRLRISHPKNTHNIPSDYSENESSSLETPVLTFV